MGKPNEQQPYYRHQHSCFLLQYHLVIVTKYSKNVITGELKDKLISFTKNYFQERKLNILEINTDIDHIHILFDAPPNLNLATFVNAYKSASSRIIRRDFKERLESIYWKPYFWSKSYFLCTVSDRTAAIVKKYIQNQNF